MFADSGNERIEALLSWRRLRWRCGETGGWRALAAFEVRLEVLLAEVGAKRDRDKKAIEVMDAAEAAAACTRRIVGEVQRSRLSRGGAVVLQRGVASEVTAALAKGLILGGKVKERGGSI